MKRNEMLLSIIVPCFNEQDALPIFYKEVKKVLLGMGCDYELVFIDDGSNDATLEILRKLCGENEKIIYLSFSRNFGTEAAIYADLLVFVMTLHLRISITNI